MFKLKRREGGRFKLKREVFVQVEERRESILKLKRREVFVQVEARGGHPQVEASS
jgi:hypothetical protein